MSAFCVTNENCMTTSGNYVKFLKKLPRSEYLYETNNDCYLFLYFLFYLFIYLL